MTAYKLWVLSIPFPQMAKSCRDLSWQKNEKHKSCQTTNIFQQPSDNILKEAALKIKCLDT